jgi:hypothetical protein
MSQAGLVDVEGSHPQIPTEFVTDDGIAIPIANVLEILGTAVLNHDIPLRTTGSGNTVTIEVQYATTNATTDATKAGVAAFNSTQFTVDANGFVSSLGGSTVVSFNVDAATPPGTDPVLPDGSGIVTVTGGQVAAGTTANVIQTNSLAANTYTIQIQRSSAQAVSTIGANGVAHFNSAEFTVDANGFVSLAGGGLAIDSIAVQTGTSPIVPTSAGLVTINGAVVAAGTNPIRTDGTGANTMAVEVQISQAIPSTNVTNIGLSAFNSAFFTVDANGFVSVSGTGLGQTITGNSGGALSPTAGNWNIFGASVAAGTTPVATSGAVSTLTVNVQRAQAIASTNATNVGLAAFNSAQFTVDANGFVSLAGGGLAIDSIALQTGTSPISPDGAGLITFNGSTVAAGTNPVRTNGTGANTMALQVQFSQAIASTNATNVGLAAFNSAQFTVDANGFVSVSGTVATTYTENSGSATPSAGNLNILGPNSALTGFSPWTVGSGATVTVNMPGTAKWVVNPTANLGTHTTIAGALSSAVSGETIFITPGTYTENLTLKAGVDLVSFSNEGETPNVTIIGNATLSAAGSVTISGIRLQTNSAAFLTVSGSAASLVYLDNCVLNCTNNTGISFTSSSSSAQIWVRYCRGNIGTTGISLWSMTSAGNLAFSFTEIMNTGASTTASTNSAGTVQGTNSNLGVVISTSSTGGVAFTFCLLGSGTNTTAITHNGSGSGQCYNCTVSSGTASAISIGSGASMTVASSNIISSNTNAITGAGTVVIAGISFSGSSSTINTTTQTLDVIYGAQYKGRTDNSVPSAGMLGEFISAGANAVAVVNATAKTIASMVLTPGTWLVSGFGFILNSGIVTSQALGISTTNNTMPAGTAGVNFAQMIPAGGTATALGNTLTLNPLVQYVATNTTYYIVAVTNFTTGTGAVNAFMTATRIA